MVVVILEPNLTPIIYENENNSWYITNQSAYFSWKINNTECSKLNGLFRGYHIILKVSIIYTANIHIYYTFQIFFCFIKVRLKEIKQR